MPFAPYNPKEEEQQGTQVNVMPSSPAPNEPQPQGATAGFEAYKPPSGGIVSQTIPSLKPAPDTSPKGFMDSHPWLKTSIDAGLTTAGKMFGPLGEIATSGAKREEAKNLARTTARTMVSPLIQFPKTIAGEAAGALGMEDVRTELMAPTKLPFGIEVKQPSADTRDVAKGAQTPLETGFQAVETAALIPGAAPEQTVGKVLTRAEKAIARKAEQELVEYVMPKMTGRKATEGALLGEEGRAVTKEGIKGEIKVLPGKQDKAVAETVRGIVNPKNTAQQNIDALDGAITKVADEEVRPFLKANPKPFNQVTINARLSQQEMPTLFKSDEVMEKTYDLVRQRMMRAVKNHPKTMEGLWDARKEFDQSLKNEFPRTFDSTRDTAITRAAKDMRKTVNDYIVEQTPTKDNKFKEGMKKMSNMYEAMDNIAARGAADEAVGSTTISRFKKKHPVATDIVKLGGAALLGGSVVKGAETIGQ